MSPFNIGHAANVIVRALIPIFGIAFLGWSGTKLLVVYLADTLASLYGVAMLAFFATATRGTEYQASIAGGLTWVKRLRTGIGVALTPLPFLLIVGFFFGVLPLFVMLDMQDVFWREFLADRDMWIAVSCQFAGAVTLLINQLDWAPTMDDPPRLFRHQIALFGARWGAMMLIGFFLAAYIPRLIYGPLLIITYAVATIALELAPRRVLNLLARVTGADAATAVGKSAAASIASKHSMRTPSVAPRAPTPMRSRTENPPTAIDSPDARRLPSLLLLLVGAALAAYSVIRLWNALDVTLHGIPATAKVIEYHATSSRSASIVAQVEVTVPGERPFRIEVYDGFGVGSWADGGTIDLLCTKGRATYTQCVVDSALDRWLLPVVLCLMGLVCVWWSWRIGRLRRNDHPRVE